MGGNSWGPLKEFTSEAFPGKETSKQMPAGGAYVMDRERSGRRKVAWNAPEPIREMMVSWENWKKFSVTKTLNSQKKWVTWDGQIIVSLVNCDTCI